MNLIQNEDFLPIDAKKLVEDNSTLIIFIIASYLPLIFMLQKLIGISKFLYKPLKYPLVIWNFSLAIFSILGMIYTAGPSFESFFSYASYVDIACKHQLFGNAMLWITYFTFSKLFEFGDTIFKVLRGSPIHFLQWYHHITTCILCFVGIYLVATGMVYGAFINFTVHSVMYIYFAFATMGYKFKYKKYITVMQFSQMVIMVLVIIFGAFTCYGTNTIVAYYYMGGTVVYSSFVYLFYGLFNMKGKRE